MRNADRTYSGALSRVLRVNYESVKGFACHDAASHNLRETRACPLTETRATRQLSENA